MQNQPFPSVARPAPAPASTCQSHSVLWANLQPTSLPIQPSSHPPNGLLPSCSAFAWLCITLDSLSLCRGSIPPQTAHRFLPFAPSTPSPGRTHPAPPIALLDHLRHASSAANLWYLHTEKQTLATARSIIPPSPGRRAARDRSSTPITTRPGASRHFIHTADRQATGYTAFTQHKNNASRPHATRCFRPLAVSSSPPRLKPPPRWLAPADLFPSRQRPALALSRLHYFHLYFAWPLLLLRW